MDVLVVGGGIAGLATARALRRRDVPVTVAERGDTDAGGLAINLPGNAVTAFAALGLADGLQKLGRTTHRREYRSARDRLLFAVDEDAFWGPEARPRCVRRSDLLALLADGLDAPVRRPLTVTAVRPVPGGAEATFGDGARQTFGLVAGADGVHSVVRATAMPAGATGTQTALLSAASWRFMAPNPGVDCWTVWSGRGGAFLLIPVDDDTVYGYASATGGGKVSADASWLQDTFGDYPAPVRRVLDGLTDLYHSPVEEVRTGTWASGNCVLVGDAAHATAPVWAQGAALAVEDGLVLADLLADGDWDGAGARYEQLRRERVTHVQAATDRFSRAAALPVWLRDRLLPRIGPRTYRTTYDPLRHPFPTP
ncbi:FAD-dependent oxidoreductase [Actinoplanes hulinensis]|uniref:FAD-dependent oxidoreductase n=1 Tax=Actinoplanes hulinensis TaxID=1144547 RepID=A0ABS7BCA4_9ACTN|nr:FAD-dependent oxidoreductase [Actinoplanes hulinensis]MBW6438721.1 FAD-dependent oxidoreductase [Actinoplanes hulinensis]